MPAKPRSEVFVPHEVGVYHCWNRLVQRRHLFGWDRLTGRDYSYRKPWVRDRLKQLAAVMAVDVLDFAILDNHLHVVLRNRPDIVNRWSDDQVARRWWSVCPLRREDDGSVPEPKPCEIGLLMQHVDDYRARLSSISWMMRLACQPIARRANAEDNVDGRFFAKRFDCTRLESEADLLACSIYVDLNLIYAGMADSPEDSQFTSIYDRIRARWQSVQADLQTDLDVSDGEAADAWLAPVFLDERANAYPDPSVANISEDAAENMRAYPGGACNPIGAPRLSNKGFLPLTVEQYVAIVDSLGRVIRRGKRGHIPAHLPPILERLSIHPETWYASLMDRFKRSTLLLATSGVPPG